MGYKIYSGEVQSLKIAIEASNLESKRILDTSRYNVAAAEKKALESNMEIDNARKQFVETSNALDAKLDTVSLLPRPKPCHTNPMPTGTSSQSLASDSADAEYAANFDRVIKEKAKIADDSANYAMLAYQFVSDKCGIK